MKLPKEIDRMPKSLLLKNIQKLPMTFFCMGLLTGIGIVMTGLLAKSDDFKQTFTMLCCTIFFLFLTILFYIFFNKKTLPEIEKKLKD